MDLSGARANYPVRIPRHLRLSGMSRYRWVVLLAPLFLIGYIYEAAIVLPQWIVSLSASTADPNTQLNAVTNTRGALLGILTPLVIVIGGIVALLNYREVRDQNRRTNDQARAEREETRRVRRGEVYAELLSACHDCMYAAIALYLADERDAAYGSYVKSNIESRAAMDLSQYRLIMLGAEPVRSAALAFTSHCGLVMATKAGARPKLPMDEWLRITGVEYANFQFEFVMAAQRDLAPAALTGSNY